MKKLLALILAVMMIATLSVTAFAEEPTPTAPEDSDLFYTPTDDDTIGTENSDFESSGSVEIVLGGTLPVYDTYYVVVTWDVLYFQYSFDSGVKWDPEKHEYYNVNEGVSAIGAWMVWNGTEYVQGETIADAITVTNHSNATVQVNAHFGTDANKSGQQETKGVTVTIADGNQDVIIDNAEGTEFNNAPNKVYKLTVSGVPTTEQKFTLGTITVTVSKTSNN